MTGLNNSVVVTLTANCDLRVERRLLVKFPYSDDSASLEDAMCFGSNAQVLPLKEFLAKILTTFLEAVGRMV